MNNGKHRAYTGAPAVLFLLAAICFVILLPGNAGKVRAESIALPDLVPDSIVLTPEQPANGNTVEFTITVSNRGDAGAGSSRLSCFIDDTLLESAWVPAIDPGGTVLKTFAWKAAAGPHIVKATIDDSDSVAEADENNNEKSFAFSVLAPDLAAESISWLPENPSAGDKVTISVTVKNRGTQPATGSTLNLKIDGNSRGNREIPGLETGAGATVTYTWMAIAGPHTLEATADYTNLVKEGDETNNTKTVSYVTAAPDISIDSITWSPQSRSGSDNVTMTVKIRNAGSGKAAGFRISHYIDDVKQTEEFVEGLQAGGSVSIKYSWIAGPGAHSFKSAANPRGELYENNMANNEMTVVLPAVLPDLVVQSITRATAKSVLTDGVIIIVVVKNQGLNLSWPGELSLYVNESYKLVQDVPPLNAGETMKILFNCIPQDSPLALKAIIDEENLISETNESNNTRTVNIGVPDESPDTDLTIESIAWAPSNPSVGDTVTITTGIKSKGPGHAGHSHVDYFIDDTFLESVYAGPIEAGETIVNTVKWQAGPGEHILKAIADCDNNIAETNEINNEKSAVIRAAAPDLIIQSIAWTPEIPKTGDEVTFSVTIKNRGDMTAGSSHINYYIDGVSQGRHFIEEIPAGDSVNRTFTWTAREASWAFRAVIDEEDSVEESSESNNEKTLMLPAPDLTIESITFTPPDPSENASVTLNMAVKNGGAGSAGTPKVTVYANGSFLALVQFDRIDPGETASGACAWTAQGGNYTFKAIMDEADTITENDEYNNEMTFTLSVNQPEDATVETSVIPESFSNEIPGDNETEAIEDLLLEGVSDNQNLPADISDTSAAEQPWWQKILTNKILIIGVGAAGLAALAVLALLRRKSRRK